MLADLTVLRLRSYRYLFLSQTISLLGSAVAPVALAFAVLDEPAGSASALGFVLAARSLGQVIFLLAGGVLADRLPRFQLMAGSNLLACCAQGAIAGIFITRAPLGAVIALAAVNGAAAALFQPASRGVIPQIVPKEKLQPANALMRLTRNGASILGPALAGVLVVTAGPGWALAFDALTFAIAAGMVIGIKVEHATRAEPSTLLSDLREGWREFRSRPWVWLLVLQFAFVNGCFAAVNVLGPLLAKQYLGGAPAWATVLAAMAVGLVSGSLLALRLRPRFPLRLAATATFGFLPPFFLLAMRAPLWLIAASMLVNGICVDIFEVLWDTALQTHVPNEALSRITSYDLLGSFVLGPFGLALAGPVAATIGAGPTLVGAGSLLAVVSIIPLLTTAVRQLPATGPATAAAPAT